MSARAQIGRLDFENCFSLLANVQSIIMKMTMIIIARNYYGQDLFKVVFLFFLIFIYFIFGCVGSLLLHVGFPLVAASGGLLFIAVHGLLMRWLLWLWSTGSRRAGFSSCGAWAQWLWLAGSVVVVHGLRCCAACGIFPAQGSNPCPLSWQADS